MTEAELLEIAQATWSNVLASYAIYITVLSGYLIVAYTAGAAMTRSQIAIVNTVFIPLAVFMVYVMFSFTVRALELASHAVEMSNQFSDKAPKNIEYLALSFNCLMFIVSLKFMWDIRHPKIE